jgi:RecB family exonuclease
MAAGASASTPASTPARSRRTQWHSVSSTREYETCPRRYRFGYVEKRPKDRPVPTSWRFGTVVHAGLEAAWRAAMEADPDVPLAAHLPLAVAAAAASVAEEGLDDADRERAERILAEALAADVVRATDPDAGAPAGRPIGVEEALRGWAGGDHDRVIGFADLVLEHPDGTIELVDHKVTSRRADPDDLREDFQLNLYGHLASKRWPRAPRIVATLHYPTGPEAVRVELTQDGMRAADRRVRATARTIASDDTFAPVPSAACEHCPWQPSCPEGAAWGSAAVG